MRRAFTLVEVLMAVMIFSIMTIIGGVTFNSVINGWKRSTAAAERMQGADYALNQIAVGLRSAYYPADGNQKDEWGFALIDGGDGEDIRSSDMIEFSKLGNAIIGDKSTLAETSHRVRLWVEDERSKDEPGGLWARVWNPDLFSEEGNDNFDDEEYGEEFLLVEDIVGFDCVVQKDFKETENDGRPKWEETWDTSNCIPYRVKLTFRLKAPDKGEEPLPLLRVVEIPVAPFSQAPFAVGSGESGSGKTSDDAGGKTGGGKGGTAGGGNGGSPGPGGGRSGGGPGGGRPGGGPGVGPGGGGAPPGGGPVGGL